MDSRAEVREFLTTRRAKISPEQVGLPAGTNRRVAGLRRGEVAALAGVSIEYYTRLERGAIGGASAEVLDALARALLLDDAERAHLFHLAQAAHPVARPPRRRNPRTWTPHPGLQWALDAVVAGPAFVRNGRMDVLGTNLLGRAFYDDVYAMGDQVPNLARFCFLADSAHRFYPYWDAAADVTVAILRAEAGRDPRDKDLHDLVGELSTRSEEFRRRWSAHNVRYVGAGVKLFHHDLVGDLELGYESVDMLSEPGLTLTLYAAEPCSPTEHALELLGSWTSTEHTATDLAEH